MALVFVTGFNADSNSGNFLPEIESKIFHRLRKQAAFPKILKNSDYKINCQWNPLLLFNSLHVNIRTIVNNPNF